MSHPARSRLAHIRARVPWSLLGYGLSAVLLFHSTWVAPRTRLIGVPGDSVQSVWWLAWTPFALAHGHNPLLSTYLNAPDGVNLMWNTPVQVPALALWPVTAWLGPVLSYNLVMTLAPALSAWCAQLVLRRWVHSTVACVAGGLLYGFSPYVVAHVGGHVNLSIAAGAPLLLLLMDELAIRQRRSAVRVGGWLGILAVLQLFTSEEVLATEAVAACVLLVVLAGCFRAQVTRARITHLARGLVVAAAVTVPVVAYPLWVQFRGPQRVVGIVHQPDVYVTDGANLVIPALRTVAVDPSPVDSLSHHLAAGGAEQGGYVSLPLVIVLLAVVYWQWRRPQVRVAAITGGLLLILAMGSSVRVLGRDLHVPLPGAVFPHLPLLGNLLPTRFTMYCYLCAAVLLAVFIDQVIALPPRSRSQLLAGGLLVASAVLLFPTLSFPSIEAETPAFFTTASDLARIPVDSVLLVAPYVNSPSPDEPMLWQAQSGMRFQMPEGYFLGPGGPLGAFGPGPSPVGDAMLLIQAGGVPPALNDTTRANLLADLHHHRVTAVAVGPMACRATMLAWFTDVLGSSPVELNGVLLYPAVP